MKEIDELIEKYNHEIKYLGLQGGALHIKKNGVKDLEQLKEKLKEQHKEDVIRTVIDIYCVPEIMDVEGDDLSLDQYKRLLRGNAEQYYKETFE